MITLTLLMFFTGILSLVFLFNDTWLLGYEKIAQYQKENASQYAKVQRQSMNKKQAQLACHHLSLPAEQGIEKITYKNRGVIQGFFCQYHRLFKQNLRKNLFLAQWHLVEETLLAKAQIFPASQPLWLTPSSTFQFIYLDKPHNTLIVKGKVYGVILAKGSLSIQGSGEIRGVVITQGELANLVRHSKTDRIENPRPCIKNPTATCMDIIKLIYDKKVSLWAEQLGVWEMLTGSWYDFNKQILSE